MSNDIIKSFMNIKILLAIITIVTTVTTILIIKITFDNAIENRKSIFILDKDNTLKLALSQDVSVNRLAEAEAHVKRFHKLFFILSPDAEFIKSNMSKAMEISDKSTKHQYDLLVEKGYFTSMIASGVSSEFLCDSVNFYNSQTHEVDVILYGKTSLVHSDKVVFKTLKTSCSLRSSERTVNNPNGFTLCNWQILENNVIGQVDRKDLSLHIEKITNQDTTIQDTTVQDSLMTQTN